MSDHVPTPDRKIVTYRATRENFDDAYDRLQAFVAECRQQHPTLEITWCQVRGDDISGYNVEVTAQAERMPPT